MTAVVCSVTVVMAASFMFMIMVMALSILVEFQPAFREGCGSIIGRAGDSRIDFYPACAKSGSCASADASAYESFHTVVAKEWCESSMSTSGGSIDFLFVCDFPVFDCVDHEFLSSSEVLEY